MKIDIPTGININFAAALAIKKAKEINGDVTFDFNEISLSVRPTSDYTDISYIYFLKHEIRHLKVKYEN